MASIDPGAWIVVGMMLASIVSFVILCCCHIAAEGKGEDE